MCHFYISISCRQVTVVDQRVYIWVSVYLSPPVLYRIPSSAMKIFNKCKGSSLAQIVLSMRCLGVVIKNTTLPPVFKETSSVLSMLHLIKELFKGAPWKPENSPGYCQSYLLLFINRCNRHTVFILLSKKYTYAEKTPQSASLSL